MQRPGNYHTEFRVNVSWFDYQWSSLGSSIYERYEQRYGDAVPQISTRDFGRNEAYIVYVVRIVPEYRKTSHKIYVPCHSFICSSSAEHISPIDVHDIAI